MYSERLDRQLRIEGWDQESLENKPILIVGDKIHNVSQYLLSASALGIKNINIISPILDKHLTEIAKKIEPSLNLNYYEGDLVSTELYKLLKESTKRDIDLVFSTYNLPKKIIINECDDCAILSKVSDNINIVKYLNGIKEKNLENILEERELIPDLNEDPISSLILSAVYLEETKKYLMNGSISNNLITYKHSKKTEINESLRNNLKILLVGAGALGNFVGMGLGYLGIKNIDIIDPDDVEYHNLNRQVLFYNAVDKNKAEALSEELNNIFGVFAKPLPDYFNEKFDTSNYDIIFDAVDNFATRIAISEAAKANNKILISGGTNVDAGQVITYIPNIIEKTPAERLNLYEIVKNRKIEQQSSATSCTYRPDPSVIMSNQLIAGIMVDVMRKIINKEKISPMIVYNSNAPNMIGEFYE